MKTLMVRFQYETNDFLLWLARLENCLEQLCLEGLVEGDIVPEFRKRGDLANGIKMEYEHKAMEVISDEPGEIIIRTKRYEAGEKLMKRLMKMMGCKGDSEIILG